MGLEPDVNEIIVTHVDPGETLSEIAARYGVSVDELQRWNRIDNPDFVQVGQRIVVYKALDAPASSASEGAVSQEVPGPDVVVGSWDGWMGVLSFWRFCCFCSAGNEVLQFRFLGPASPHERRVASVRAETIRTKTRSCYSASASAEGKRWRAIGPFGVGATIPRLDAV